MTQQSGETLFLADDDQDDCFFFETALKEINFKGTVDISTDGLELMENLSEKVPPPPTAIFLDLNMPKKNGMQCLSEIRLNPALDNTAVIILSTSGTPLEIEKTFNMGASFYIVKPNTLAGLKSALAKALTNLRNFSSMVISKNNFLVKPD